MPMILAGWKTYLGVALKVLAALLAALTALSVENYNEFVARVQELIGIVALYFTGDALGTYGVREAIQRKIGPDKAEDPKALLHPGARS